MSFRGFFLLCFVHVVLANDFVQRKSDSDYVALEKGQSNALEKAKVVEKSDESHGQSQGSGNYGEKESKNSAQDAGKYSAGELQARDEKSDFHEKGSSGNEKKGHHRSGFSKNYHKSESGNDSSFYEDSEDSNSHKDHDRSDEQRKEQVEAAHKNKVAEDAYSGYEKTNHGKFGKDQRCV